MTLSVLVVDPDVEVLGDLASRLRALGLEVAIADSDRLALERARARRPDAIVIERGLDESTGLSQHLAADRALTEIPCVVIADADEGHDLLARRDAAALARHLYAVIPRSRSDVGREGDFRGDLSQVSAVDLLQLLCMNRRSGALSISTSRGAGEVRLQEGEIVDAVFRRQEGEKALFRLLAETDGSFSFAGGAAAALRRIQAPTSHLLMEGMRQIDEVLQLRHRLDAIGNAFVAEGELSEDGERLERDICRFLTTPNSLEDLLDELGEADLRVLNATARLLEQGHLRPIERRAPRPELAPPDRLHLLGALVKRLTRDGYAGGARLIFAGDPRRLTVLGHSLGRMAEAEVPASMIPAAPVPHTLATVKLPEGARLELVALPLVDAFGALWGLTLPGSAAVVQLGGATSLLLEELAQVVGVPLIDARDLLGELDERDPQQATALLSAALDHLTGT